MKTRNVIYLKKPKVIDYRAALLDQPIGYLPPRAMLLAYKSGDRCIACGNGGFHIGRTTATCANPRCQLPVPLG